MSRYRLTPEAVKDLDEITDFIAADNPTAAEGVEIIRVVHGARDIPALFE